jgi:DNA-binding IclR family transcriptional regulator
VPVRVSSVRAVAALNVVTLTARACAARLRRAVLPSLLATGEISPRLGYRG